MWIKVLWHLKRMRWGIIEMVICSQEHIYPILLLLAQNYTDIYLSHFSYGYVMAPLVNTCYISTRSWLCLPEYMHTHTHTHTRKQTHQHAHADKPCTSTHTTHRDTHIHTYHIHINTQCTFTCTCVCIHTHMHAHTHTDTHTTTSFVIQWIY